MKSLRCVTLCLIVPWSIHAQGSRATARDSQTVVFVCEHGTVKSVVAFAYFNQLARARHLPIKAVSRGTNLEAAVPPIVRDGLRRDGLALGSFTPTELADSDLANALAVVTFDRPSVADKVTERTSSMMWNDLPPVSANYGIARDSIRARVARLVDSLSRDRQSRPRSR